jgi:hypothetical protein
MNYHFVPFAVPGAKLPLPRRFPADRCFKNCFAPSATGSARSCCPTSYARRSHIPEPIVTILYHNKKDAHQGIALYIINSEGIAYHPQLVAVYHQAAGEMHADA